MHNEEQYTLFPKEQEEIEENLYTKICIECEEEKLDKYFEKDAHSYRGIKSTCKECRNKSKLIRKYHRKRISTHPPDKDYECPICSRKLEGPIRNGRAWHVDHCHKTGKVRGYLCYSCNSGLGLLKDSIHNLQKAIEWLRKDEGEETNEER